jgi:polar amino acid transport system substrate-binding protein
MFSLHIKETVKRVHATHVRNWKMLILAASVVFGGVAHAAPTLTAGSPPTSAPNTFLDVKDNTLKGLMPDVMREIGRREGFETQFDAIPFSALIQSVVSGKIDAIVAGMKVTPARAKIVDFANPVYSFGEALAVQASDTKDYTSAQDLKGLVVGSPAGVTYGDTLAKMGIFKEVKYYDTPSDMLHDLAEGRIQGAFCDAPIYSSLADKGGMPGVRFVKTYKPFDVSGVAIAVRKGNTEMLTKINDGLAQMKADGTLAALLKKWKLD